MEWVLRLLLIVMLFAGACMFILLAQQQASKEGKELPLITAINPLKYLPYFKQSSFIVKLQFLTAVMNVFIATWLFVYWFILGWGDI